MSEPIAPVAVQAGTGWQTLMADLSIILFMVAASVVSRLDEPRQTSPVARGIVAPSPQAEPLALYRDDPGAPPLAIWLAEQSADPRQQLTIFASYRPGGRGQAMARAEALADSAGAAGIGARIVIEPGAQGVIATLAYDQPAPLARSLR